MPSGLSTEHGNAACWSFFSWGACSSLAFPALRDYLTTSSIQALKCADNAVTELLTATSIIYLKHPNIYSHSYMQHPSRLEKQSSQPCMNKHPEAAVHQPFSFMQESTTLLVHWFMKPRCLMPGVPSIRSWAQTVIETALCYAYTFSKGFFNQTHGHTAVCPLK